MKSTEVRIGNLVLSDGKVVSVSGWYLYQKTVGENTNKYDKNLDWQPIKITKKWLRKLGFTDGAAIDVFVNGRYDIERFTSDSDEWEFCINEEQIGTNIKYVHELQNLYFSLTGEELTIK